ncbi:hypothetical protein J2857_003631 [Neorhizobium galegae]|uniref:hypothetical protein n=1 Tax=Neorhizobium galegae TaxID=399 RepID=UPI001AEAE0FB|nr:hypothetical protein [Neorhizobium galegae]MBP2560862.1 hypothetical protein [Neorhizobium galegae]
MTKYYCNGAGQYLGAFDEAPNGTIEIPDGPVDASQIFDFTSGKWGPSLVTVDHVAAERDRRLKSGFAYNFGDQRGIHYIGTSDADMRRWMDEVCPIAQACINVGQPEAMIGISTETGRVDVSASEWQMILLAAGQYRQPLYQASFDLQAMDPIPADFATNPAYWP